MTVYARSFLSYFIQDGKTAVHYAAESASEGMDKWRFLGARNANVHAADKFSPMVSVNCGLCVREKEGDRNLGGARRSPNLSVDMNRK